MRSEGRAPDRIRPLGIETDVTSWAEGVALVTWGRTRVLCTASVEERVPPHRRGTRGGWVTAEYGMLPRATSERTQRERGGRIDGRSLEIQRLVARSLRAGVDLSRLGERTVTVDCDVLHADGGTRTAAINGGYVALALACRRLEEARMAAAPPIVHRVAAVSLGLLQGVALLDLDYGEDSRADTDLNLVMSDESQIVEIQGTAEGEPFDEDQLGKLLELGRKAIVEISRVQAEALASHP